MLPDQSSRAVSLDRTAHLDRRGDPDATGSLRRGQRDAHEGGGAAVARLEERGEVGALADPPITTEGRAPGRLRASAGHCGRGPRLSPQALTSLGAATLDHQAAAPRPHANEEAVSPSPATIVGLERSLHCFWNPLRKVEPRMLSGIAPIVKTSRVLPPTRVVRRVIVVSLCGASSCPKPSPAFEALWLIR